MRIKALSHDSIFTLEPEPKRSASKTYPSPDVQRGRPLQIPPLRPRQASNSPPLIRSDTISKDSEESSADEESPKSPRKKVSSYKVMTLKKYFLIEKPPTKNHFSYQELLLSLQMLQRLLALGAFG
ncbi:Acrosomal protein [Camelus dromedarius]|uniref:Acrosomal protein n=1 Tax=Camelus dromedarius TaxID=9838 RepID=A0A5N4C488_CAMDR|nr:Acrosomal protein [Camelus dromedarius]